MVKSQQEHEAKRSRKKSYTFSGICSVFVYLFRFQLSHQQKYEFKFTSGNQETRAECQTDQRHEDEGGDKTEQT